MTLDESGEHIEEVLFTRYVIIYRFWFLGHGCCHIGPDLRVGSFDNRRS